MTETHGAGEPSRRGRPRFALDAETLRVEYEILTQDYRGMQSARLASHATSLTAFLGMLTVYGVLAGAGIQYADKLTIFMREAFEVVAVLIPILGLVIEAAGARLQYRLHSSIGNAAANIKTSTMYGLGYNIPVEWTTDVGRARQMLAITRAVRRTWEEILVSLAHGVAASIWLVLLVQSIRAWRGV